MRRDSKAFSSKNSFILVKKFEKCIDSVRSSVQISAYTHKKT